jgi:hypothetical protein
MSTDEHFVSSSFTIEAQDFLLVVHALFKSPGTIPTAEEHSGFRLHVVLKTEQEGEANNC